MTWTADKIRAEMKRGQKAFVIRVNDVQCFDLKWKVAARLDGYYTVQESPHEVVIHDNYKRRKAE